MIHLVYFFCLSMGVGLFSFIPMSTEPSSQLCDQAYINMVGLDTAVRLLEMPKYRLFVTQLFFSNMLTNDMP